MSFYFLDCSKIVLVHVTDEQTLSSPSVEACGGGTDYGLDVGLDRTGFEINSRYFERVARVKRHLCLTV